MSTEKRLLLAAALSLVILLLWTKIFPEPQRPAGSHPPPSPTAASSAEATESKTAAPAPQASQTAPVAAPIAAAEETLVTVENGLLRAAFSNRGGVLTSLTLVKYKDAEGRPLELVRKLPAEAPKPFSLEFGPKADITEKVAGALFVAEKPSPGVLRLRYADSVVSVSKEIRLGADYLFDLKVGVSGPGSYAVFVGPGLRNTTDRERQSSYVQPPTAIASIGGSRTTTS